MAGNVNRHRIEELDENTEYNVTVEARSGGTFDGGRHSVMSTDDLSELAGVDHAVISRDAAGSMPMATVS